jgi:hypothetical protein
MWGKPTEGIRSQNYEKIEAINANTMHDKAGHDGPQDQATRPHTPSFCSIFRPRSSTYLILSIFIYFGLCFELKLKIH